MPEPLRIVSPVHKATRQFGEYMLEASHALGVEPNEGHLLSYTTLYGPCPASELVRVFGYKPSTLTGTLDRLEQAGFVIREPNVSDRRSILIRATPEGAKVATELRARLENLESEVIGQVKARDMTGFVAVMKAIGDITRVQLRSEKEGGIMTGKDALQLQYRFFYLTAKRNLEGMSAADAMVEPTPGGNSANWILGHMVGAHNGIMGLANAAPVWESEELTRTRSEAFTSADQALDWDVMVTKLIGSEERLMTALGGLTDEQLDEGGFEDPFGNPITRGQFLNLMAVHQNYHAGQLGLSRRIAGLPGAIQAPQRQEA